MSWRLFARDARASGGDGMARRDDRLVAGADAERLAEQWEGLRFWSVTPADGGDEFYDGTSYVLKAAERGRYWVVGRDDPEWEEPFREFADLLVRLAGLDPP